MKSTELTASENNEQSAPRTEVTEETSGSRIEGGEDSPGGSNEESFIRASKEELPEGITVDQLCSVVSNRRRRAVLQYLKRYPEGMAIREVCTRIAADENGEEHEEIAYEDRHRIYTALHQSHIPMMKELGLIEYDQVANELALADRFKDLYVQIGIDGQSSDRSGPLDWRIVYWITAVAVAIAALVLTFGL